MPAIVGKTLKQMRGEFQAECGRLAEMADTLYRKDITTPLYLIGSRKCGLDTHAEHRAVWYRLSVAGEFVEGWEGVTGERIPRNRTWAHLAEWFYEHLSREPLWIFAD